MDDSEPLLSQCIDLQIVDHKVYRLSTENSPPPPKKKKKKSLLWYTVKSLFKDYCKTQIIVVLDVLDQYKT